MVVYGKTILGRGNDFFAAIPRMTTAQNPGLFTTFMKLTETQ